MSWLAESITKSMIFQFFKTYEFLVTQKDIWNSQAKSLNLRLMLMFSQMKKPV